jgi:hypothetical protein
MADELAPEMVVGFGLTIGNWFWLVKSSRCWTRFKPIFDISARRLTRFRLPASSAFPLGL